ncbi:methylated-DNA--[protein]-cysteine S-methyltransferase [Pseudomonas aeruginosa]
MAYHSSVGCDRRGDQPTGYATPSACFHTPEITITLDEMRLSEDSSLLAETERQLREYFSGKRSRFELPLDFQGTEFQKKVWSALLTIPFGETRSYTEIAVQIGSPNAVRAVGAANGRNPLSIVAPCHRVIGASGGLTGFAGGLAAKQWLLRLESRNKTPDLLSMLESS